MRSPRNPHHIQSGGRDMTMEAIASWLSGAGDLDLPIVDRTGLHGTFDFLIDFVPEPPEGATATTLSADDSSPTFADALKDQLGLQMKKQRGSSSIFVIDHIERPSAN